MYNYIARSALDPDLHYLNSSKAVVDKLFVALSGDFSSLGKNYSESFKYEFSDGSISLLGELSKFGDLSHLEYSEWVELRDNLLNQKAQDWEDLDAVLSYKLEEFLEKQDYESFSESFDFVEISSEKMEEFLGKVISTIYTDGVTSVMSNSGEKPSEDNNYLMDDEGNTISGIFTDEELRFVFNMNRDQEGKWSISYSPTEESKEKLGAK